jgi:hypothetical protein
VAAGPWNRSDPAELEPDHSGGNRHRCSVGTIAGVGTSPPARGLYPLWSPAGGGGARPWVGLGLVAVASETNLERDVASHNAIDFSIGYRDESRSGCSAAKSPSTFRSIAETNVESDSPECVRFEISIASKGVVGSRGDAGPPRRCRSPFSLHERVWSAELVLAPPTLPGGGRDVLFIAPGEPRRTRGSGGRDVLSIAPAEPRPTPGSGGRATGAAAR